MIVFPLDIVVTENDEGLGTIAQTLHQFARESHNFSICHLILWPWINGHMERGFSAAPATILIMNQGVQWILDVVNILHIEDGCHSVFHLEIIIVE